MWQQIQDALVTQFFQYGAESIGYFIVGICFSMFYRRSTQRRRFHLIGKGCYVCGLGGVLMVILPALKFMNPAFEVAPANYALIEMLIVCIATSFLWGSLFVKEFASKQMTLMIIGLAGSQLGLFFLTSHFFPDFNFVCYMLASAWFFVGIGFLRSQSVGKTALFGIVGDSLIVVALFYVARELNFLPQVGFVPMLLFGGLSLLVLIAQLQFMESSCDSLDEQLLLEKKRRTLFWDIAPFPILVSKLLDDSVLYINPAARDVLKIEATDVPFFRLTDYFSDPSKRNELVEKVRQNKILDTFEVQMCSPRSKDELWLDLSARVVELDGELALYINLHNMTQQKQTEEKLFKQASTDALTGLYNRRQFEAMFQQAVASAERYNTPYCVMMGDIDHFKKVNDTYGHEAGDIVLKEVARLMKETFRTSDIIGRFGGEEFITFFSNTDIEGAKKAAEHLRAAVEAAHIEAEGKIIPVTISLGLTDSKNTDLLRLTKEADLALYYSKEHGRNQVSVYYPSMDASTQERV